MIFWKLLLAFTRANLLGYGGGPSAIPLIRNEVVSNFKWLTDAEFADTLAIGNTLPGPIATKMAAYVGYRVDGFPGALAGLIGTVLPTAILMVAFAAFLLEHQDSPVIKGMIAGAKPVVWVLFLLLVVDYLPFVRPDKVGVIPTAMAVAAFVAVYYFKVNQGVVISLGLVLGALFLR